MARKHPPYSPHPAPAQDSSLPPGIQLPRVTVAQLAAILGLAATLWQCVGAPITGLRDEMRSLKQAVAPIPGLVEKVASHDQELAVYRQIRVQRDQEIASINRRDDKQDADIQTLTGLVTSGNAKLDQLLSRKKDDTP